MRFVFLLSCVFLTFIHIVVSMNNSAVRHYDSVFNKRTMGKSLQIKAITFPQVVYRIKTSLE